MKLLLVFVLLFSLQESHSQAVQKARIELEVGKIDSIDYYYTGEENDQFFDQDSTMTGFISIVYRFSDQNGKKLILVDELNQTPTDSSSIIYYFKNKRLLKADARMLINGELLQQDFYFSNEKLIYQTPSNKSFFKPETLLRKAKKYLKFKCKICNPSFMT